MSKLIMLLCWLALAALTGVLAACQSGEAPTTTSPPPTESLAEVTVTSTEEMVDQTPTATATEEAEPPNTSADANLYLVVTRADRYTDTPSENPIPESFPELAEGQQFVFITATLGNEGDETINIAREALALRTTEGTNYAPIEIEGISPLLYGMSLAGSDSVIGFVLFSIPVDSTPDVLAWCPTGVSVEGCAELLQYRIPDSSQ